MLLPFVLFASLILFTDACTNLIVTPGASLTQASIVSYAADSHTLYGAIRHFPALPVDPSGTRTYEAFDWDSALFLSLVPDAGERYNVLSNMNEFGVAITETTFEPLVDLQGHHPQDDRLDYANIMWLALRRSKNAVEAITVMGDLIEEYGWISDEGESISIADADQVWVMEVVPKGKNVKGAVWVAVKVPDGHVTAHANHARIRTFRWDSPSHAIYSPDVMSFAIQKGLITKTASKDDFSFSDTYAPVNFESARFCEARVWSFFNKVNPTVAAPYISYARGLDLSNRMPFSILPLDKLGVSDVQAYMRDHFEGTYFDMTVDVGSGPFSMPYRWRPLTWSPDDDDSIDDMHSRQSGRETYGGRRRSNEVPAEPAEKKKKIYLNERAIATQQTAFSLVAEPRNSAVAPAQFGRLWFGVDDAATSVYYPVYVSSTKVADAWREVDEVHRDESMRPLYRGGDAISQFSFDSAFWVFNMLSHLAYLRYSVIYPDIKARIERREAMYVEKVAEVDANALAVYHADGMDKAVEYLSDFTEQTGQSLFMEWKTFYGELFVKHFDGDTRVAVDQSEKKEHPMPKLSFAGYPKKWYARIADETGDKLLEPDGVVVETSSASFFVSLLAVAQVGFLVACYLMFRVVLPIVRGSGTSSSA